MSLDLDLLNRLESAAVRGRRAGPVKVSRCAFVRSVHPARGGGMVPRPDRGPEFTCPEASCPGNRAAPQARRAGHSPVGGGRVGVGGQAALTPLLTCDAFRKKEVPSIPKKPQRETPHHQREVSGPAGQTAAGGAEAAGGSQEGGVLPPELGQQAGRQHRDLHPGPDAALGRGRAPPRGPWPPSAHRPSHSRLIPPASPPRLHVAAVNTLERPDVELPAGDFSQTARMPTPGAGRRGDP